MYSVSPIGLVDSLTVIVSQCVVPRVCSEIKVGDHKVHTTENPSVALWLQPGVGDTAAPW